MERMTAAKVAELAEAILVSGPSDNLAGNVARDSREVNDESVFFALIGDRDDGHRYVKQAYDDGCRIFVISSDEAQEQLSALENASVLRVGETRQALYRLAKKYLAQFDVKKIAVTGSSGKTTTKDMLECMLSSKYNTIANDKNFNNDIGVCLTVFKVDRSTEFAVFEMGMNHEGEIHLLADIVRPDIACITNIGNAHIGNLGSRENIMKAKMEITDFMNEDSVLVYNIDNDMLASLADRDTPYRKLAVGYNAEQDGLIMVILNQSGEEGIVESSPAASGEEGITFILRYNDENMMFYLPVPGVYNASNAAVAAGCAVTAGMDLMDCSNAIMSLDLTENRMSITRSGSIKILDDTYNASPDAVKAALGVLASTYGRRRIAVLADMLELGALSEELHRETGRYAAEKGVNMIVAIGSEAGYIADAAQEARQDLKTVRFENNEEFVENAADLFEEGDVILVKGSHSMHMNTVVDYLKKLGPEIDGKEQKDE